MLTLEIIAILIIFLISPAAAMSVVGVISLMYIIGWIKSL